MKRSGQEVIKAEALPEFLESFHGFVMVGEDAGQSIHSCLKLMGSRGLGRRRTRGIPIDPILAFMFAESRQVCPHMGLCLQQGSEC